MREDDPAKGSFRRKTIKLFLVLDVLVTLADDLPLCCLLIFKLLKPLDNYLEEEKIKVGDLIQKCSVVSVNSSKGEKFAEVENSQAFLQDFLEDW